MDSATWAAVFTVIVWKKRGQGWKTTAADEITWSGSFEGIPLIVLSRGGCVSATWPTSW